MPRESVANDHVHDLRGVLADGFAQVVTPHDRHSALLDPNQSTTFGRVVSLMEFDRCGEVGK
jgi:hypothetical protein